jgi:3-dehydroquinate dehydratase II|tara:strand:- start:199 stop:639 length:441 start_codon:yes stop_codon:yes gene_type:complete
MKKKIIIINGPNLNLLGEREKSQYGSETLPTIKKKCLDLGKKLKLQIKFVQSNIEGELVTQIQKSRKKYDGLIINAGGYTHTSVSILDALLTLKIPIIELHISNIYSREVFRQKSLISRTASGIICGFGTKGYIMSINALNKLIKK